MKTSLIIFALLVLVSGCMSVAEACPAGDQPIADIEASQRLAVDAAAQTIFDQLRHHKLALPRAKQLLRDLDRRGSVIGHLRYEIAHLEADDPARHLAYLLLISQCAGILPGGVQQFLAGLDDKHSHVRGTSARGFLIVRDKNRAEVGAALIARLRVETDAAVRRKLLGTLSRVASPALAGQAGILRSEFTNPENTNANRQHAAQALIRVEGVSRAVGLFRNAETRENAEATLTALKALHRVSIDRIRSVDSDEADQQALRSFVLEHLRNDDLATRTVVISRLLLVIFGPDPYAVTPQQIGLNKELNAALVAAAKAEEDSNLREYLQLVLTRFHDSGRLLIKPELRAKMKR